MSEDAQGGPQVELFIHDGTAVDLDSVKGEFLFLGTQKGRRRRVVRQDPEGEDGEQHATSSLDDEEVPPVGDRAGVDVKDTECQKSTEGVCDRRSGVKQCQSSSEFSSSIKH